MISQWPKERPLFPFSSSSISLQSSCTICLFWVTSARRRRSRSRRSRSSLSSCVRGVVRGGTADGDDSDRRGTGGRGCDDVLTGAVELDQRCGTSLFDDDCSLAADEGLGLSVAAWSSDDLVARLGVLPVVRQSCPSALRTPQLAPCLHLASLPLRSLSVGLCGRGNHATSFGCGMVFS